MSPIEKSAEIRTAMVTGASAGLGAAIARALGELGWRVVLGARRNERLEEVAGQVRGVGGDAFAHPLDVADPESVEAFFAAAEAHFGTCDVVVNNAGMSIPGRLQDLRVEDLQREVAVNLLGPMYVSRRAIPSMMESGRGGDLLFISSDAARNPRPQQTPYSATKAGLENLSHALAMELEGTGIRTTIVRPGLAQSEFGFGWGEERIGHLLGYWQHFGLQRHMGVMPAEAVARAVVVAVTTPRGVHLGTLEVHPEAPRNS